MNTNDISNVSINQFIGKALANTSGRYRPVDTESLVQSIIRDLGIDATVDSVSGRGHKSTKHAVVLTLPKPVLLAGTACFPRIYVRNSYNGESALTVRVGFYRLVCTNGMMIGTTHFNGRIVHLESGVKQLAALRRSLVDAVEWCTVELSKLADRLNQIILTPVQITTVLASIGASKRLGERVSTVVAWPFVSLRAEDHKQGQITAWNLWNIVNEQQRTLSRSPLRQLEVNARLLDAVEEVCKAA